MDCTPWLPHRLHAQHSAITEQIAREPVSHENPTEGDYDPGYSFSGLGACDSRMLVEVARRYRASGDKVRPVVFDMGAGQGFMARKIILAGGQLIALERSRSLASKILTNLTWVKPYLDAGETLKSVARVIVRDVVSATPFPVARADVVWAGFFVHMLTPAQVVSFAVKLFALLADDGIAFITAHTASACNAEGRKGTTGVNVEKVPAGPLFRENKAGGMAFPGFMGLRQDQQSFHCDLANAEVIYGDVATTAYNVDPNQYDVVPGTTVVRPTIDKQTRDVPLADFKMPSLTSSVYTTVFTQHELKTVVRGTVVDAHYNRIVHFVDRDVLVRVFTDAGFAIREAFYTDSRQQRVTRELTAEDFDKEYFGVYLELERRK